MPALGIQQAWCEETPPANSPELQEKYSVTEHSINIGLRGGEDRLVARLAQEPFALVFSGQGFDWMKTLRVSVAQGAGRTVAPLVDQANSLLEGVYDEIAGMQPYGFDPIAWAQQDSVPFDTVQASLSVPGIFTS